MLYKLQLLSLLLVLFPSSLVTIAEDGHQETIFDSIIKAGKETTDDVILGKLQRINEIAIKIRHTQKEALENFRLDRKVADVEVDPSTTPPRYFFKSPQVKLEKLAEWDETANALEKMNMLAPKWSTPYIDIASPANGSCGKTRDIVSVSQIVDQSTFHAYALDAQKARDMPARITSRKLINKMLLGMTITDNDRKKVSELPESDFRLIIKGLPTDNLVDNKQVPINEWAYIGKEQYETTSGSMATVFTVNIIDKQQFETYLATKIPKEELEWQKPEQSARTWKAAQGGFSVEAKYVRQTSDTVSLTNATGKVIDVPIQKLSPEDQAWLKAIPQVEANLAAIESGSFELKIPDRQSQK
jgi:hypothetical protein